MASPKRARRSEGDDRDRHGGRDYDSSRRRTSNDDRRGREREDRHDRRGDERARSSDRERRSDRERSSDKERPPRDADGAQRWRNSDGEAKDLEKKDVSKEFRVPRSVENVFKREHKDEVEDLSRKRIKEEPFPTDKENEAGEEAAASPKTKDKSIALMEEAEAALEAKEQAKEKEKASFEYSGNLASETNKVGGVALQFTEPPEARQPTVRWRLYVFKDGAPLDDPLFIHRQSCYLFGRERKVADIPIDHPSCSKQHAVIQYRLIEKEVDGLVSKKIRPYVMDLGSTNKTFLNGEEIEAQRYYELFEKDTLKFGNSSREYVLLHENSA